MSYHLYCHEDLIVSYSICIILQRHITSCFMWILHRDEIINIYIRDSVRIVFASLKSQLQSFFVKLLLNHCSLMQLVFLLFK